MAILPEQQENTMKIGKLSVSYQDHGDWTFEEFLKSEWALTPLGKLLTALVAETVWSNMYEVSADFALYKKQKPFLRVEHQAFLDDVPLTINESRLDSMSVRAVENALRQHIIASEKTLESAMSILQRKRADLSDAVDDIGVCKAKAAIVAVFPEATNAMRNHVLNTYDLSAFVLSQGGSHEQVFLARQIDGEFVRGIVRIRMEALAFYRLPETEKRNNFWKALALAFAEKELGLSEGSLFPSEIEVEEKEGSWPYPVGFDPYVVKEVLFRQRFPATTGEVVVTFGADNMPASVVRREKEIEV